jgi:hypothetical protein
MFFRLLFLVLLFFWTIPSWAQFKSFQLFSSKLKVTSEIVFNDSIFTFNVRKWKRHYLDIDIVPVFVGKVVKSDEEISFLLFGKPFLSGILNDSGLHVTRLDNFLKLDILHPEQPDINLEERHRLSDTRIDTIMSFVISSITKFPVYKKSTYNSEQIQLKLDTTKKIVNFTFFQEVEIQVEYSKIVEGRVYYDDKLEHLIFQTGSYDFGLNSIGLKLANFNYLLTSYVNNVQFEKDYYKALCKYLRLEIHLLNHKLRSCQNKAE